MDPSLPWIRLCLGSVSALDKEVLNVRRRVFQLSFDKLRTSGGMPELGGLKDTCPVGKAAPLTLPWVIIGGQMLINDRL